MLFDGGPLARDGYIVVAMLRSSATTPLRFIAVRDRLGTIALSPLPEDLGTAVDGMRVFVGYLGWRSGELEEYLDSGALLASPRSARQVFTERPRDLWRALQADR
jgi:putative transcriptional regulator